MKLINYCVFSRANQEKSVKESYQKFLQTVKTVTETKLSTKELLPAERLVYLSFGELVEKAEHVHGQGNRKEVKELLTGMAKPIEIIENILQRLNQEQLCGEILQISMFLNLWKWFYELVVIISKLYNVL